LTGYDLVVSSSHCVAKGAIAPRGVPHLCYCHTPMRYVWDQMEAYFGPGRAGPFVRAVAPLVAARLRRWDRATASRAHRFVANSQNVRERILRHWGRAASVVYPPVDVARFDPTRPRDDFYLVVSALVPYKRIELAVDAMTRLGRRLVVVGSGPEQARLSATTGDVRFTGWVSDEEVADLMAHCRAIVMPGVEDFGIVPVEAQAAGAPVIALGEGGALETVVTGTGADATGVLFEHPTSESLARAVLELEARVFDPAAARRNALRFGRERFLDQMRAQVVAVLEGKSSG
jgi:glycosyltransferase involved in cell wall biosynthesis